MFIRDSAFIFLCFNEKQLMLLKGALIVVTVQYLYVQMTKQSILSSYLKCYFRWERLLKESSGQSGRLIRKEKLIGRRRAKSNHYGKKLSPVIQCLLLTGLQITWRCIPHLMFASILVATCLNNLLMLQEKWLTFSASY